MLPPYFDLDNSNQLVIDGVVAADIANRFGTPVYVISIRTINAMLQSLHKWIKSLPLNPMVAFAYKACPVPAVTQILSSWGVGAEVASGLELELALKSGVPPKNIILNGPGKSISELKYALELGVGFLNIESEHELALISEMNFSDVTKFGLRIDVKSDAHGNLAPSRFGFPPSALGSLLERYKGLSISGIHCHLGTNITQSRPYHEAFQAISNTAELLRDHPNFSLYYVDLGGGYAPPVSTMRAELEKYDTFDKNKDREYAQVISKGINELKSINKLLGQLVVEPGRYLVGSAGCLLTRVVSAQSNQRGHTVIVDAGQRLVATNSSSIHDIVDVSAVRVDPAQALPFNVYGPLCYEADVLAKELPFSPLQPGSVLAIFDCGAYDIPLASPFIRPLPPVALVDSATIRLVRKRQRFIDVFSRDV